MRHVIELRRAGLDRLIKATMGSTRAHLYVRRERYYKNGKPMWRYFYRDDEHRQRSKKQVEDHHSNEKVDHHLLDEVPDLYDSHRKNLPPTSEWTEARLSQQLVTRPKVEMSAAYRKKHHLPHVEAEKHGRSPDRNITQRIAMALGMLPERMQKLAGIEEIEILDSDDPRLKAREKATGRPVPACFMESNGRGGMKLVLVADEHAKGINTAPHGEPHFGSSLTLTEERIWHQVGLAIAERAKGNKKLLKKLGEFRSLSKNVSSRDVHVSGIAQKSWTADFAESFACMMSHPKQLASQAPDRYSWLRENGFANSQLPKTPDALLDEPASKWAWYEAKEKTRTRAHLDKLKEQPPHGIPYRSEKDQFYSLSVDGRTVYFRIGPPDRESEAGWERMPDPIDPKTGLPQFDSKVSNAFHAPTTYKEVYDDHGNRLDPVSAYFYLQQGDLDEKWEAKLDDAPPDDPAKIQAKAKSSRWDIARKIFNTLGENKAWTEAEKKKEAQTVAKLIKQGKIDEKRSRWAWTPSPIDKSEFYAKTPTFQFDDVREAQEQPHVIPGQMDHDARGRAVPALWQRVYEVHGAGGQTIRMNVQEAPMFEPGQEILAPVVTEKEVDGELVREQHWRKVELAVTKAGRDTGYEDGKLYVSSLDPKIMAREIGVSQQELIHRNGKFRQHQLIDPVMAALINPNNRPIRQASDLMNLIHEAAKSKSEAWVSVHFDDEVPPHAMHAKVRFDGGGSPLLIGDYWKRKLGMENPRIEDLLASGGKLRMEKPRVRKPRRPKIKIGDVVRFTVNGHEVFGHLLERSLDGKRSYKVAPLKGQESPSGWERMPETVSVGRVLSVPSDRDPENPNVRLREYRTPETDVLLYADEVEVQTKIREMGRGRRKRRVRTKVEVPGSGKVKIKLPKDGSWTLEEMARIPGVTVASSGELLLDVRLIDQFRERVGGFVMDDHTQRKLRGMMEQSKAAGGARPHKVAMNDIVDPLNGNRVRTDGLLKGCRELIGDRPFSLGQHQAELLQAMADADGRILAAHFMGTGKTVSAVAAVKMMQNLTLPNGQPHPNRPKRVLIVVPKNTVTQWENEGVNQFTYSKATVVGSSSTTNALQMWKPPKEYRRKVIETREREKELEPWADLYERLGMTEQEYNAKVEELRQEAIAKNPRLWRPEQDDTDMVIVPQEYFTSHSDELLRIGGFDGMIVDEAHGIQRKNRRSDVIVKDWNERMKMMMLLTGTPITNRLNTLPRYIELLSKGKVLLGGEGTDREQRENFEEWAMTESALLKEMGAESSVKLDINPQAEGRLIELIKKYIHVATSADVVDKTMPAVLLDENSPVTQTPVQASLYRGHLQELTPADKALFSATAALGEDENILSEDARASIRSARMICNTPGYKKPDGREFIYIDTFNKTSYQQALREERKKLKEKGRDPADASRRVDVSKHKRPMEFRLPNYKALSKIAGGKWPTTNQLLEHFWDGQDWSTQKQVNEFHKWMGWMLGTEYESLAGKPISSSIEKDKLKALKEGEALNGISLGKKIPNPEYGPEGVICRGAWDPVTGTTKPIEYKVRDASGKVVDTITVPVGMQWIRDPAKKSAGIYYAQADWQYRDEKGNALDVNDSVLSDDDQKATRKGQRPKDGHAEYNVNNHPARRRERLMFDLAMTTGNAKTDQMERDIAAWTDPAQGGHPDQQMIWFANSIGSGVRCVESKLRMLGYRDVNEALNSNADDLVPPNGKYYVTYLGGNGTLGDRDINSEIFRKRKNPDGSDSAMSIFVHRTLHGTSGKIKPGKPSMGWTEKQRETIEGLFDGVRMPARVMQDEKTGKFLYFYDKDLKPSQRRKFRQLEDDILTSKGAAREKAEARMKEFLSSRWSEKPPLTERQIHVFNNCQMMVASDAAQVGLNWGNATKLSMYDSLFSPMAEWQRITRAARMLPPAVRASMQKHFDKLHNTIEVMEGKTGLHEFDGDRDTAMSIVQDALDKIPEVRDALMHAGMNPEATAEAFLAQRALDRIRELRPKVEQKLRTKGRVLTNSPKIPSGFDAEGKKVEDRLQTISKHEITTADVTNEILEGSDERGRPYLSRFEKEILRSRKYIVDVKRYTTSVETPITAKRKEKYRDESGKTKTRTVEVQVGMGVEYPSAAEKSQLTRSRAKQAPFEHLLSALQSDYPVNTSYDFEATSPHNLAKFSSELPESTLSPAEKAARERASRKFYGPDKSGKTLRQREAEERKRLKAERRKAEKERKAAIRAQRRRETMERNKKAKMKKSLPFEYL